VDDGSACRAAAPPRAQVGWNGGRRRPVYSNRLIAAMYVWSVWHDRTLCWACRRGSYGTLFRPPRKLPSVSQFSRRVRSDDCQRILQLTHDTFAQRGRVAHLACVDGKALPVGPVSRDRDARRGRISGAFARGYKLHALVVNEACRIVVWSVTGLGGDEKTVARVALLPHAPPLAAGAVVLADSNYDSAPLHRAARPGRTAAPAPGWCTRCVASSVSAAGSATANCGRCRRRGGRWCARGRSGRRWCGGP
jgi:hypothetical protein